MLKDTVTIICPTYNEEKYIEKTLLSFTSQKVRDIDLEILVVDGRSQDRTRNIIESFAVRDKRIRLLDNPEKRTPFAFNKGLKESSGEYVAILGAHTFYDDNYVQTCYDELKRTGSVGCTGRIISKVSEDSGQALLCEWVMSSKFGVSGKSFRTIAEGYAHTVNFPVYKKNVLLELGGYDTTLHRNQDNDLNQRIIQSGEKLYVTWKTQCYYRPPSTLKALLKYGRNTGYWNAISFFRNKSALKWYHFVPFLFVCSLILLLAGSIAEFVAFGTFYSGILLGTVLGIHLLVGFAFALKTFLKAGHAAALLLPFAFISFHFSYGWGTLMGFFSKKEKAKTNRVK